MIIKKRYKISFNYKKLILYLVIVINPVILYLGNENISLMKFGIKIIYFAVVIKLLVNREVYNKISGILIKLKNKVVKK